MKKVFFWCLTDTKFMNEVWIVRKVSDMVQNSSEFPYYMRSARIVEARHCVSKCFSDRVDYFEAEQREHVSESIGKINVISYAFCTHIANDACDSRSVEIFGMCAPR